MIGSQSTNVRQELRIREGVMVALRIGFEPFIDEAARQFIVNGVDYYNIAACPFRKSYPDVLSMQSAKDRDGRRCSRSVGWSVVTARPSVMTDAGAPGCNNPHRQREHGASGPRRKQRSDPGIRGEACRSDARRSHFARAILARSGDRGCP